jgi:NADH dehydrogenase
MVGATQIVVLGGGFGGFTAVRHLERVTRADVEITLVSRENFFVLTPLLFEACSGRLELRHCAQPIRSALQWARFIQATVEHVDVDRRFVRIVDAAGRESDLPYDHLVVGLGASTNRKLIPGSEHAFTFKTMADALVLRNHVIEQLELADASGDSPKRAGCLTIAVIGGGLVGVELTAERFEPAHIRAHAPRLAVLVVLLVVWRSA